MTFIAGCNNTQIVRLSVSGSHYVLEPSVVKKGVPVKIIADSSVMNGCSSSFTIPDFQVNKYFTAQDNSLTFTPNKSGTFDVACSMRMFTGTITVE